MRAFGYSCLIIFLFGFSACDKSVSEADKAKAEGAAEAEGSAKPAKPQLNQKIANAVARATKTPAMANVDGPPPNGLFVPAVADQKAKLGMPAAVKVGASGSGKKVTFRQPDLSVPRGGSLEASLQLGPRTFMPNVAFTIRIAPSAADPEAAEGGARVVTIVTKTELARTQPGQVPPELEKDLLGLTGAQFTQAVSGQLPAGGVFYSLPAKANPQLASLVSSVADALGSVFLAYPDEPVGVGGFWMITQRERFANTDVVAYRMVKVSAIDDETATLQVQTRRYAAEPGLGMPDFKTPPKLLRFEASDSSTIFLDLDSAWPRLANVRQELGAVVDGGGQERAVQVLTQAVLNFPKKKK